MNNGHGASEVQRQALSRGNQTPECKLFTAGLQMPLNRKVLPKDGTLKSKQVQARWKRREPFRGKEVAGGLGGNEPPCLGSVRIGLDERSVYDGEAGRAQAPRTLGEDGRIRFCAHWELLTLYS